MNGSEICMRQLSRLVVSLCCNHYNKYQIIVNIKLNILKTQTIINNFLYTAKRMFYRNFYRNTPVQHIRAGI